MHQKQSTHLQKRHTNYEVYLSTEETCQTKTCQRYMSRENISEECISNASKVTYTPTKKTQIHARETNIHAKETCHTEICQGDTSKEYISEECISNASKAKYIPRRETYKRGLSINRRDIQKRPCCSTLYPTSYQSLET